MKYLLPLCGAIALSITLTPQAAQASAYKTASGSTYISVRELGTGVANGQGYYYTMIGGTQWKGRFQATTVTVSGGIKTYAGSFTDNTIGGAAMQQCQGSIQLKRPTANSGPAPLTVIWTIGPGGVNCPSAVGSSSTLYLNEVVPVANGSGNFLASNANTIISETAGPATWPKWVVVDPTGLNCRATAPSGAIVTTFPNASTVDVAYLGLNSFITAGGNSWLRVPSQNCFIRANSSYIKPKLMPF
jgi:hypothetical protein